MIECQKCLLRTDGKNPTVDQSGMCSYCRTIEKYADVVAKIGAQPDLLRQRLQLFKDVGQFDCLVGFSGGKDSSYVIYRLRNEYNARILTFTWDNGFLTDYARENINHLVEEFDLEHLWVKPHGDVLKAVYKESVKVDGWPCSACFTFAESSPWKLAYEKRIPFIVNGRIPEQILRTPTDDSFESNDSLIVSNLKPYDRENVFVRARSTLNRIERTKEWLLPDRKLWPLASESIYLPEEYPVPEDFAPELLSFFLFERHNESRIMDILEKETSWIRPDANTPLSHADCEAHDAAGYMYHSTYARTFINLEISALIRHGKMTVDEGRQILVKAASEAKLYPRDSMKALSEVSGLGMFDLRSSPTQAKIRNYWKPRIKRMLGRK